MELLVAVMFWMCSGMIGIGLLTIGLTILLIGSLFKTRGGCFLGGMLFDHILFKRR